MNYLFRSFEVGLISFMNEIYDAFITKDKRRKYKFAIYLINLISHKNIQNELRSVMMSLVVDFLRF